MQNKIHLKFLDDFTCLASDCPDDCCHGWNIHLDAATLKKWRDVDDETERNRLLDPVVRINDGGKPADVIKRREDDTCPNLEDSGLCRVQRQYGHDFLPQTCQAFPRVRVENQNTVLETMHLSCPAVARMLVMETENELFSFLGQEPHASVPNNELDLHALAQIYGQASNLLLKATKWPLAVRLYFLADMLTETARRAATDDLSSKDLRKLCPTSEQAIDRRLKDVQKQINGKRLKFNKNLSGQFWHFVLTNSDVFDNYTSENASFTGAPLVQHLKQSSVQVEEYRDRYFLRLSHLQSELHDSAVKKSRQYPDRILANYLTAKFMNHGFPWYPYRNHFILTFLDCLVPFFLIRTLLDLHLGHSGQVSDSEAATIIYKVEKSLAHNLSIFEGLEETPELLDMDKYAAAWI